MKQIEHLGKNNTYQKKMMSQNVMHGKKSPKQRSRNMPAKPRQLDLLNQAKNMDQIRPKSRDRKSVV